MTNHRPRIAHIIHWDGPGGGPVSVIRQLMWLAPEFDQMVISDGHARLTERCRAENIPYVSVPFRRKRLLPVGFHRIWRVLRRFKPAVAIVHGQWAGPVGALAAGMAGVPRVVYVARWPAFYAAFGFWRCIRNWAAEWIPTTIADTTVVLSEGNLYQYLIRNMVRPGRMVLIPNCFDPRRLPGPEDAARVRSRHGWRNGDVHVVSAGRLNDQKRVNWLIESWAVVRQRVPRAKLWIAGDGADRGRLEAMATRLGIADSVAFLGRQDESVAFIMASDVVAMTSLYEGHANVPLEAMACGRPIVASDVDGVRESVTDGETGFLVPPGDTARFAECLVLLLDSPSLREEMGSKALSRAAATDSDAERDKFISLVRKMASAGKRGNR